MNNWKSILKADQTNWLLEDDNPSVRYFTLIDLLEKSKEDPEVLKAKAEIMQKGVVPKILAKQKEEGYWEEAEKFYTAKYKGTVWQIMYQDDILEILGILTQLGYHDQRMQEAIDILVSKQDGEGKWKLENTFNGRFQTNIEQKGKKSKWITLNALKVLKKYYYF